MGGRSPTATDRDWKQTGSRDLFEQNDYLIVLRSVLVTLARLTCSV